MNILPDCKIAVGIITYNRPEFLKEAVSSVLQQSFENFELIISNDYQEVAVTQESLGVKNDSRIKIVNQDRNLGETGNMNFLLDIAQSEWFVWLADDDLLHPEFLALASKAIVAHQDTNMVGFFSSYSAGSHPDGIFPSNLKRSQCVYYSPAGLLKDYTSHKCPLLGSFGVMRTDILRKIGGMPRLGDSFGPYSDTLIPILMTEHGNLCWLDEHLIFLRTHANSLSVKSAEFSAFSSAEVEFLRELERVCASRAVNIWPEEVCANMIRRFAGNEWAVLARDSSLRKGAVSRRFIQYQMQVNLPRLSFIYRIKHLFFMLRFLAARYLFEMEGVLYSCFQRILTIGQKGRSG